MSAVGGRDGGHEGRGAGEGELGASPLAEASEGGSPADPLRTLRELPLAVIEYSVGPNGQILPSFANKAAIQLLDGWGGGSQLPSLSQLATYLDSPELVASGELLAMSGERQRQASRSGPWLDGCRPFSWVITSPVQHSLTVSIFEQHDDLERSRQAARSLEARLIEEKIALLGQIARQLQLEISRDSFNAVSGAEFEGDTEAVGRHESKPRLLARMSELDLERTGVRQRIDLNSFVTVECSEIKRTCGPQIEVLFSPQTEPAVVDVELMSLRKLIQGLVSNAREAMNGGGTLRLTISSVSTSVPMSAGARPGSYVLLSVTDTGSGMDSATASRVFDPSFSTRGSWPRRGFGLAQVYAIVRRHSGHIAVDSKPGVGTVARVWLPKAEGTQGCGTPQSRTSSSGDSARTILVIDDEDLVRQLARRVLERDGYRVVDAKDTFAARTRLDAAPTPVHLVLIDVTLLNARAGGAQSQVEALVPGARCLFMSGFTRGLLSEQGLLREEDAFIQKPFSVVQLTRRIREVLQ